MSVFQWLGVGVAVAMAAVGLHAQRRGRNLIALCWTALWVAAAVAMGRPELVAVLARALGIGRGADLLLYCWVMVGVVALFSLYARQRQMDGQITKLVRHIALEQARRPRPDDPAP